MLDSFDKGWFVLQTYSGYENKVKENLLQRAQTYNMLENILRVEIPTRILEQEKRSPKGPFLFSMKKALLSRRRPKISKGKEGGQQEFQ